MSLLVILTVKVWKCACLDFFLFRLLLHVLLNGKLGLLFSLCSANLCLFGEVAADVITA